LDGRWETSKSDEGLWIAATGNNHVVYPVMYFSLNFLLSCMSWMVFSARPVLVSLFRGVTAAKVLSCPVAPEAVWQVDARALLVCASSSHPPDLPSVFPRRCCLS
jgi:hypothetical protein